MLPRCLFALLPSLCACLPGAATDLNPLAGGGNGTVIVHGGGGAFDEAPTDLAKFATALPNNVVVAFIGIAPGSNTFCSALQNYSAPFGNRRVVAIRTTAAGSSPAGDAANDQLLSDCAAQLRAAGVQNIEVIASSNAGSPAVVQAAEEASFYLAAGGNEANFAHAAAMPLGQIIRQGVIEQGKTYHGMSAGAMGGLAYLSSTAFFRPLQAGLGVVPGVTALAHAEQGRINGRSQLCTSFRAVGANAAEVALAINSDSYVVVNGSEFEVPAAFTFSRNGTTETMDRPVLVFRAGAPKPQQFAAEVAGGPYNEALADAYQTCAETVQAAIGARASTALDGAIEIYYPGQKGSL